MRRRRAAVAVLLVALVAGCSAGRSEPSRAAAGPATSAAAASKRPVMHPTVWLCRPGMRPNPCEGGLDATVVGAGGGVTTERFRPAADPPVDCFYVYPTVSPAPTRNAPLRAGPAEVTAVRAQAARFAEVCRLFAPVYRQITTRGLVTGGLTDRAARELAHGDVVSAWHEYLNQSAGRRFVLIGHSQGTFELTRLIQEEIDGDAALRARLVSALLIGGYVSVRPGSDTGDLTNIPACRRPGQTGCVVAYNSFAGVPPPDSVFGRPSAGREILCVNPAALAGGSAPLRPYVPAAEVGRGGRGFVSYPGALRAECRRRAGVSWLDVTGRTAAARRLLRAGSRDPAWGLHRADVTLALGDLVALVRTQVG